MLPVMIDGEVIQQGRVVQGKSSESNVMKDPNNAWKETEMKGNDAMNVTMMQDNRSLGCQALHTEEVQIHTPWRVMNRPRDIAVFCWNSVESIDAMHEKAE